MLDTSARLLRLLGLLQAHPVLTGSELATRLDVTARTIRRDITRLRELGYVVDAVQGTGGYRLAAGTRLPPLLLTDDEALAVVMGLRTTTQTGIHGLEDAGLQALTKLEQLLPARLRYRMTTLTGATRHVVEPADAAIKMDTLLTVAEATHTNRRLRFDYHGPQATTRREVEPHHIVYFGRRWYLVAYDIDRQDWRAFRLDRLHPRIPGGPRFSPRPIPHGDAVRYLEHRLSAQTWPVRAILRLTGRPEALAAQIWPGMGALEADGTHHARLHIGAPSAAELLWLIPGPAVDFEILDAPEELLTALAHRATQLRAATQKFSAALRSGAG